MSDTLTELNDALQGKYRLEKQLGAGGMATVFLAQDLRHDRPVALKVLHTGLAATLGPERFQQEIRLAARLQHPHILTVHDSGGAAGRLWFTMPFVQGESLRDRLVREKQLPLDDALRITREIADALHYAHQQGIIHRDIKPENILLTGSHALVADFGIARALRGDGDSLTGTGLTVGTPTYMSPEQSTGERDVDARTDVYALGSMLYEMLAGEPPFTGPTPQAVISKRMATPAPSITVVRDGIPAEVERAVSKALSRTPADRFSTTAEFAKALDERPAERLVTPPAGAATVTPARARALPLAVAVAILALAVVGFLVWNRSRPSLRPPSEAGTGGPKRVAVLPFENLGAADDEYFADGITDEVRGKLTSISGFRVTARTSSNQYKKSTKSPQQIGQELGVQYLLTGTVRWEKGAGGASRVKVSPELIEATTGAAKWQQPFDAVLSDVFQVQGDIAGKVAQALGVALGAGAQQQLAKRPTTNLAAYEAFVRGQALNRGRTDLSGVRKAIVYYEQAVSLDPAFVEAWTQLSRAHSWMYFDITPTRSDAERAGEAADRARALAPNRPEGLLALGDYNQLVLVDYEKAHQLYGEGQRLAPDDVDILVGLALTEQSLGRWDQALANLRRAAQLDPRSVSTSRRLGVTLLLLRRLNESLEELNRGLSLAPADLDILESKAMIFLAKGDLPGARAVVQDASKEVDPASLVAFFGNYNDLAWMLEDEQKKLLLRLTPSAFDNDRGVWGVVLTQAAAYSGDAVQSRRYAEQARLGFEEQVRAAPKNAQVHSLLGLALVYLGRFDDAVREGEQGLALQPIEKDGFLGPYVQHLLVRIHILAGHQEKALDLLQKLLEVPYQLTPAWLRIDPTFDPLRNNPRFRKIIGSS